MIASIIILVIYAISLGMSLAKHGEEKKGNENFWISLLSALIMIYLMYLAGTFDKLLGL